MLGLMFGLPLMAIFTSRLYLRDFQEADWQDVHAYSVDPEVLRYIQATIPSEEETHEVIRSWINGKADQPPHYDFAVISQSEKCLIGWCCIQISIGKLQEGELMYVFNRKYWGQGYATEAARAVLEFGFLELKLHRIWATCRPMNVGSRHVLEKLGMRQEGHLRQHVWMRDSWHDSYLYAILDHEWRSSITS